MNNKKSIIMCLYQFNRPKRLDPHDNKNKKYGDCYNCETDIENNKKCSRYIPISVGFCELNQ